MPEPVSFQMWTASNSIYSTNNTQGLYGHIVVLAQWHIVGALTHGPIALATCWYDCPSLPVPCYPAWLRFVHLSTHFSIGMTQRGATQRKWHFADFFVPVLCSFGHRQPSNIPGFLDYARQCNMHNSTSYPCCATMLLLLHEQPYHDSSNCARAKKVYHAWAQYGVLSLAQRSGL